MAVATAPRSGVAGRLLAAFQPAQDQRVTDFSNAVKLWTERADLDPTNDWGPSGPYMMSLLAEATGSRFVMKSRTEGLALGQATFALLSLLLQNNWGLGLTLVAQIQDAQWLSLLWVDDRFQTGDPNFYVLAQTNAWFHTLTMKIAGRGKFLVEGKYAAEFNANPASSIGGGGNWWTDNWFGNQWWANNWFGSSGGLPIAPMNPDDVDVFSGYNTKFIYDPTGRNLELPYDSIKIEFNHRLIQEWDQLRGRFSVHKGGKTKVKLSIQIRAGVEAWMLAQDTRFANKKDCKLIATTPGGHQFTIDFNDLGFDLDPGAVGHEGALSHTFSTFSAPFKDDTDFFVNLTLI